MNEIWLNFIGHRPPLLEGCPKPIETLMTTCWDPAPANRPSMEDVVKVMTALCVLFPGAEQPLEYYEGDDIDVSQNVIQFLLMINKDYI